MAAGDRHSMAVTDQGKLFTWGHGGNGQLGQGAYDDVTAAVGDVLSFSYTGGYHDVMLVDNGNCDFSGGTMLDGVCTGVGSGGTPP